MILRASMAVLAASACSLAHAGVITFSSDAAFIAYENSGGFAKTYGANVRWGSGLANGDWEYAIVDANDIPIGAVGQTVWAGSNTHTVTLDSSGGGLELSLGGIGTISRLVPEGSTSLFVRVRDSESPFSQLASIEVDLAYNGIGVDYVYNTLVGDADAEYWGIEDPNMATGFTVAAIATLAGPRTAGSDPMYQFKIGVPAPAAACVVSLGGLMVLRRRR